MMTFLIIVHLIVSILLIAAVLLQSGKGSSMANVFGGGGMETVFGAETPAIMNRITTGLAVLFMVNCILLTTLSFKYGRSSVIQRELQRQPSPSAPVESPVSPAAPTTPSTDVPPAQKN
ncbi:MAG: preprotein translocase subunit SecG [Candidatus Omnitrophica bacterium]|nr:preprotein translocase subunit SecG [Candidatus Omnitrophota bacterium]